MLCCLSTVSTYTEKIIITFGGTSLSCCMQHAACIDSVNIYPGSCKSCFSHIPVFGRKISLIFVIIYQIAHLPTSTLDDTITHFGGFFSSFMVSWLLNLIETRHVYFWLVSTVLTYKLHSKYSICHA